MPVQSRVLVLGGIRSGKSELAEALVADCKAVRYVATASTGADDPGWQARVAAHRERRPAGWSTEETAADPGGLADLLAGAAPDDALLVDDLGGWLTALVDAADAWDAPAAVVEPARAALAAAVRACPAALLVLVSPEVGLSVVPASAAGRRFADALGVVNQAVAAECDAVALVVAGQPTWLKGADPRTAARDPEPTAAAAAPAAEPAAAAPAVEYAPVVGGTAPDGGSPVAAVRAGGAPQPVPSTAHRVEQGMPLPMPDEEAAAAAAEALERLDLPGSGLGALTPAVRFAAGTQGTPAPRPWRRVQTFLLHAEHDGGCGAGDPPAEALRRLTGAEQGEGPLALLAGAAGVGVATVRCPGRAAPIEIMDALDEAAVDAALDYGVQLAEAAVDAGAELLTLASCGSGAEAAAVALIAVTAGGEPAALLGRVPAPGGRIDDAAWMVRCAAVRDALQRTRSRARDPRSLLAALGGPDLAVATGLIVGAVSRRTPVLIDGVVGVAAAMVARDVGAQTRHWLLLPDAGRHPAVRYAADVLGVEPVLDLGLGLGEGATGLAALPLLTAALEVAAATPVHPALTAATVVGSAVTELPPHPDGA
jgi:adenosyl cobinamide kinase/adenosyl cobinamide phosphate guanylyltransferase/NaMN:DMB phosphoribosyltransferase